MNKTNLLSSKLLKKCFLLLCIFFLITCQKDTDDLEESIVVEEKSTFSVTKMKLEDIENSILIRKAVTTAQDKMAIPIERRGAEDVIGQLIVDIENPTVIENGEYVSYTFSAELPEEPSVLNLLLSLQADGTYESILVRYNITDTEKELIASDQLDIDLNGKIDFLYLENWTPENWVIENRTTRNIFIDAFNQCPTGQCCTVSIDPQGTCGCYTTTATIASCNGTGGGSGGGGSSGGSSGNYDPTGSTGSGEGHNGGGGGSGGATSGGSGGSSNGNNNNTQEDTTCIADANGDCITGNTTTIVLPTIDLECALENTSLNSNSPFNVNFENVNSCSSDQIDTASVEQNEKFMCIYRALANTEGFKNLFINTFGESSEANVTIELFDFEDHIAGKTESNLNDISDITIRMNKNHLNTRHPIDFAKNIIHEAIHAYLNVKVFECSNGVTIGSINSQQLEELLTSMDYGCISTATNDHDIMFQGFIPVMQQILNEAFDELVAIEDHNPDINYFPYANNDPHIFNWQDALYYVSLDGLGSTEAFDIEINQNNIQNILFDSYIMDIRNPNSLNQESCN